MSKIWGVNISMKSCIKEIEKEVKKRFDESDVKYCGFKWFYKNHLLIVKKLSMELSDVLKANKEVVHLAAILHDIGYLTTPEDHVNGSVKESKKIMERYEIDKNIIQDVLYCIEMHDKMKLPKTIEARIIQVSDAISHTHPQFLSSMERIKKDNFEIFLEKKRKKLEWILGWNYK